jgi:hypothetical protein
VLNLIGIDGSVKLDGSTVTVKSSGDGGETVVLAAASVTGTSVRTGLLTNRFSVYFRPGTARFTGSSHGADSESSECLVVTFRTGAKELWDAMSSMIMEAARNANATAGKPIGDAMVRDAVPGRAA